MALFRPRVKVAVVRARARGFVYAAVPRGLRLCVVLLVPAIVACSPIHHVPLVRGKARTFASYVRGFGSSSTSPWWRARLARPFAVMLGGHGAAADLRKDILQMGRGLGCCAWRGGRA